MEQVEQRVDCRCPRARHRHGTWHAYTNDGCRCTPCRAAWAEYTRQRRRRIAQASWTRWPLYVPPHGTARRLQALAVLGYGANELAGLLGKPSCVVQEWRNMHRAWIYGRSAEVVSDLYDRLWCTPSTDRYALKTRNLATRRGWVPPLAWDDDEIDDPAAGPRTPGRGRLELARCGTETAARRHRRRGEPLDAACRAAEMRAKRQRRAAA